jgi:NAD(P)-dependent dehydrogenase (short-subunit alcohol dehydrogenase family)
MSISFDFTDRRYIVTGASSGIGRSVAEALAQAGATVLAVARRKDRLEEMAARHGGRVRAASVDVQDFSRLEEAVAAFCAEQPVNGSVHAAGVNALMPLRVFEWSRAETILRTSLHAGIELVRLLSTAHRTNHDGSHVVVGSVMARSGQVGFTAYGAAKSGLMGAVRSMSLELARSGVRVNMVSPGWVATEMTERMATAYPGGLEAIRAAHPMGIGRVEDVAPTILFLLSDSARWITGSEIVVDGGFSVA